MSKKICPLMSAGVPITRNCTNKCEWWDNNSKCCIVHALSELSDLK